MLKVVNRGKDRGGRKWSHTVNEIETKEKKCNRCNNKHTPPPHTQTKKECCVVKKIQIFPIYMKIHV